MNKLKTFDLSYFIGENHFEEDGTQNYLVFQPIVRYFKVNTIINVADYVLSWESKGLSAATIKSHTMSDNSPIVRLSYYDDSKVRVKFTRSCLKQPKFTYTHKTIVYIYIVYELDATTSNDNDPILKNCLFSAVTLTKNVDMETYGYTGYGLDLIDDQVFHFQVVDLIKMY